jgi:hypothetical protein
MAGNYPDAPSNRMLLDRDGAQMYKVNMSNVITQLSSAQIQALNSETSKGVGDFNLHGQNEFGSLVRFRTSAGAPSYGCFPSVHIYGNPSSGQNPNRLAIWHPTSDAHISGAYYDWGDTPRSSSADRTCRVKNMSATLKAEAITVAFDILTDTTPSVPAQFLVSEDGLTFTATADIGDLPAGGISPILTVRRNTPTNAALSVWEPRIIAQASDWS